MERTLEEAAETYANLSHEDFDGNPDWHYQNGFIAGAKWQQSDGWKSVEGNPPPEDEWILVSTGYWIGVGKYKPNVEDEYEPHWQDETTEYIIPMPTHWQPLPEPPDVGFSKSELIEFTKTGMDATMKVMSDVLNKECEHRFEFIMINSPDGRYGYYEEKCLKCGARNPALVVSEGDKEDCINKRYDPLKEDFKLLWDELSEGKYLTFENWWIDFIRYKIYGK